MLTRDEIISSYKKVDFPEKILESLSESKDIIFYSESTEPKSKKEKDNEILSQSYVLPWRLVQKNYNDSNKNNTFSRGSNFVPKEQLIDIKIENFKFIYDRFSIPLEVRLIYFKNNYGGINGPFNLNQIQNMYKNKKIDSSFEFRPIDIFCFKELEIFQFKSIKIINENNWVELVENSPLLKYNESSNLKNEETKTTKSELETPKGKAEKEKESKKLDKKDEKMEEKKEEIKEIKPENEQNSKIMDKKDDMKPEIKEQKKEEKKEIIKNVVEETWEIVQKKKNKALKEKEIKEEENEIIGLKPKNSKEGKKGKKKKKQFEDVDFELGFKVK